MASSIKNITGKFGILLIQPQKFWKQQKLSQGNSGELLKEFYLPLVVVLTVFIFIGTYFSSTHFYAGYALAKALKTFVLFGVQYFISVFFTRQLITSFKGKKDKQVVQVLVIYSFTPFLLTAAIVGLLPFLYPLKVLGLYGFYIFWLGVQELLEFPKRKETSFILTAILVNFFLFSFLNILLSKLVTAYL